MQYISGMFLINFIFRPFFCNFQRRGNCKRSPALSNSSLKHLGAVVDVSVLHASVFEGLSLIIIFALPSISDGGKASSSWAHWYASVDRWDFLLLLKKTPAVAGCSSRIAGGVFVCLVFCCCCCFGCCYDPQVTSLHSDLCLHRLTFGVSVPLCLIAQNKWSFLSIITTKLLVIT